MSILIFVIALLQAFTVKGTVLEANKPVEGASVTITGENGTRQAISDKDGTFSLTVPNRGSFEVSAMRGRSASKASTIVVQQDVDGIGIVLRPFTRPLIGGVRVRGGAPLPAPRPRILLQYPSGTPANQCDISEAGLFFCQHPDEFKVSVAGLPNSYFVETMMLGDVDLMKTPMTLNNDSLAQSLTITLAIRK